MAQKPAPSDFYLFPTGMASIYKTHLALADHYNGTAVLFGMTFMNTLAVSQDFGSSFEFFGLGSDADLSALEDFLHD